MGARVLILPGIPGQAEAGFGLDDGVQPYPESTTDFVKQLRVRGLEVEFRDPRESRAEIGFKAMEVWLPALLAMLGNLEAMILFELLNDYTKRYRDESSTADNVLHVSWEFELPSGARSTFDAHGPGSEVREAFSDFVQRSGLPAPSIGTLEAGPGGESAEGATDAEGSTIPDLDATTDDADGQD
jgi:hypothetical protein